MKFLIMFVSLMSIIYAALGGLVLGPHVHIKGVPHDAGCGYGQFPPQPPANTTG